MTPAQFIAICEALHGSAWQGAIAADLGISDRMVRFYVADNPRPIPDRHAKTLRVLLHDKQQRLRALQRNL